MALKRKSVWNPDYKKAWVRVALQNALSKREYGNLTGKSKQIVSEVLAECDSKAKNKEDKN